METQTKKQIEYEASTLIRRLIVLTRDFPMLPKSRFIVMKLMYRQGVPRDYEPEGFEPSTGSSSSSQGSEEETNITLGTMKTPYHTLELKYFVSLYIF